MKDNFFRKIKKPFLVAEISANHNGSFKSAKKLIYTAKRNGADAVKLQTYKPSSITIKSSRPEFKIKNGIWKNQTLWDLFDKGKTPFEWHKQLFKYAKKIGILCFSSPFDSEAVDLLESINCPIYKLSSFEITDFSLIKKISKTKKPIIISTGLSTIPEIQKTINFARKNGAKEIALLYCVSNYPAKDSDFNLKNITLLKKKFKCEIGLSDHSNNLNIAKIALALGATIFEKHIALDKQKLGLDIDFSLKGKEIKKYKDELIKTQIILGKNKFVRKKNELKNLIFRRSIYSIQNIKKGEKFTEKNIKSIRPSAGLDPTLFFNILNKKAKLNIKSGCPIFKKYF
jgi:pseudaminic acid synthase